MTAFFDHECVWEDLFTYVQWTSGDTAVGQDPPSGLPVQVAQRCMLCRDERTITREASDE